MDPAKIKLDAFFSTNYNKLLKMSYNVCKNNTYKDTLNDAILVVYDMNNDRVSKLLNDGVLEYYIYGIITNIKNDALREAGKHKQVVDFYDIILDNIIDDAINIEERQDIEDMEQKIYDDCIYLLSDRRNWFANRIFLDMVNGVYTSFRDFSLKTNIAHSTLWASYNKTRKKLLNTYGKKEKKR